MEEKAKQIARLMGQLANENRLLILCALLDGPKAVFELAESVPNITLPALSQHLQRLRAGGLVDSEKSGQHVVYQISDPHLAALMAVLKREYCQA